jgi:hypothetical protein
VTRFPLHYTDADIVRPDAGEARRRSAALFGNEKVAEVIVVLAQVGGPATAQDLSRITGVGHSMVRDALLRLVTAGAVTSLPKLGGTRSAQFYECIDGEGWALLVGLAGWVTAPAATTPRSGADSSAVRPRQPL